MIETVRETLATELSAETLAELQRLAQTDGRQLQASWMKF